MSRPRTGGVFLISLLPVIAVVVNKRAMLGSAVGVLGRLDWVWLPLALASEAVSFAMVARGQRRLFGACATRSGLAPFVRIAFISNAFSTSIPLAGPQAGALYSFRRFRRLGAGPVAAGWVLTASGAISSLAATVLLLLGALLGGSGAAGVGAVSGGAVSIVVLVLAVAARRRSGRARLRRIAVRMLWATRKLVARPRGDPSKLVGRLENAMEMIRLPAKDWILVSAAAFLNWLGDVAVLAVSITAVGASVPWRGLLLAYGVGAAAGVVGLTPGGVGIVEAAMSASLVASGVHHTDALASVLLYRLISFWLVTFAGWLMYVRELRLAAVRAL